jgi:hypothetical protein
MSSYSPFTIHCLQLTIYDSLFTVSQFFSLSFSLNHIQFTVHSLQFTVLKEILYGTSDYSGSGRIKILLAGQF